MFIYTMALFQDKQAKAQQEIDAVVGSNRLPSFSDRDSLPYLEAVFQEVLRYRHLSRIPSTSA
jgi:cytochrome P450